MRLNAFQPGHLYRPKREPNRGPFLCIGSSSRSAVFELEHTFSVKSHRKFYDYDDLGIDTARGSLYELLNKG